MIQINIMRLLDVCKLLIKLAASHKLVNIAFFKVLCHLLLSPAITVLVVIVVVVLTAVRN